MKHLFYLLILSFLFFTSCKEDILVEPQDPVSDETLDDRSISWIYPEIIELPNGYGGEGIEIGRNNDFYVTSAGFAEPSEFSGAIWKGNLLSGEGKILVPPDGITAVGIKYDPRTNYLFVCKIFGAFIYDATTGDLIRQYLFGDPLKDDLFVNDVFIATRAAYFTDSHNPWLYKLPLSPSGQPGSQSEVGIVNMNGFVMLPNPFLADVNANGIVGTPNGRKLIVNNLTTGILYLVDTKYETATPIRIKDGTPEQLQWGDGILLDQDRLYVCKNIPNSIAVIKLMPDWKFGWYIKDITSPHFVQPTTIARKGRYLYAINSHFIELVSGIDPSKVPSEVVRVLKY